MTPRWDAKVDANQAEIVAALRQAGAVVTVLSRVGQGCADLAVGKHGKFWWMEIKTAKGKLTPMEKEFMELWTDNYVIVRTPEEALAAIGAVDTEYHGEGLA